MEKTFYLAVYGKNQIPFTSLDDMKLYFSNSDNLFSAIMDDVKFYEMNLKQIESPLKTD